MNSQPDHATDNSSMIRFSSGMLRLRSVQHAGSLNGGHGSSSGYGAAQDPSADSFHHVKFNSTVHQFHFVHAQFHHIVFHCIFLLRFTRLFLILQRLDQRCHMIIRTAGGRWQLTSGKNLIPNPVGGYPPGRRCAEPPPGGNPFPLTAIPCFDMIVSADREVSTQASADYFRRDYAPVGNLSYD